MQFLDSSSSTPALATLADSRSPHSLADKITTAPSSLAYHNLMRTHQHMLDYEQILVELKFILITILNKLLV